MRRSQRLLCALVALFLALGTARAETFKIEIDYMVDTSTTNPHTHKPQPDEIAAVQAMFACQGDTLVVDVDDAIPHYNVLQLDPNNSNNFFGYSGVNDSYGAIKNLYFDHTGGGWHYCVFGHQYEWADKNGNYYNSGSSGLGEIGGDDFVVTLGTFSNQIGTPFDRASSLAHEFGHNLGLTHCGSGNCANIGKYPPNLPSTMSYDYQLLGVRTGLLCNQLIPATAGDLFKEIDYSHGRMCTLNENSLNEPLGTTFHAVDWDCMNGVYGTVSQDISSGGPNWCGNTGSLQTLSDYDEWANISDSAKRSSSKQLVNLPVAVCITSDEVAALRKRAGTCTQPTLTTESCLNRYSYYVNTNGVTYPFIASCTTPLSSVALAVGIATPNSAIVLAPQVFNETSGGSLVITKHVRLYSTQSAIIR